MKLRIERWAGQAGVAERLAAWHVREWGHLFAGWNEQAAIGEFMAQATIVGLPATWLAFDGEVLIGSISALLEDAPELNHIAGPWLASFYIVPEARGQGAAQALMTAATHGVAALGYAEWFLFTPKHGEYYARSGWQQLQQRTLHGETVAVMAQQLP